MQSTNHILLIQPASFSTNPDTTGTNQYQSPDDVQTGLHLEEALEEFHQFRNVLVRAGVSVTTVQGIAECPDHIFPDWFTTHPEGVIYYPMMTTSRAQEQTPEIMSFLERHYPVYKDFKYFEKEGKCLEGPAALVKDKVNKIAYGSLSKRLTPEIAEFWAKETGYELHLFETRAHDGQPVYHTDIVMYIGSTLVGFVKEALVHNSDQEKILASLSQHREVMEYSLEQMREMCGNSLEVIGQGGKKYIIMSTRAFKALTSSQKDTLGNHFEDILHCPLESIERYGGGSARCMIGELF